MSFVLGCINRWGTWAFCSTWESVWLLKLTWYLLIVFQSTNSLWEHETKVRSCGWATSEHQVTTDQCATYFLVEACLVPAVTLNSTLWLCSFDFQTLTKCVSFIPRYSHALGPRCCTWFLLYCYVPSGARLSSGITLFPVKHTGSSPRDVESLGFNYRVWSYVFSKDIGVPIVNSCPKSHPILPGGTTRCHVTPWLFTGLLFSANKTSIGILAFIRTLCPCQDLSHISYSGATCKTYNQSEGQRLDEKIPQKHLVNRLIPCDQRPCPYPVIFNGNFINNLRRPGYYSAWLLDKTIITS